MSRSIGQAAGEVRLRVAREVDRRDRRPVVGADDPPAAVDERERLEARRLPERGQPDQHRRPARRQRRDRLLDRRRQPDRLEHEVRPAVARGLADALDRRARVRRDRPGPSAWRPSAPARSIFARLTSTAMIRRAPASTAPITHDSPTPPRPITATVEPAGTSAVLITAPDARRDAAADERRDLGRHAVGHRDHRGRRHDLGRRHRPDREVGEDRRAVGARRGASCRRPARGAATASRSTATGGRAGTRGSAGTGAYQDSATGRPDDGRVEPGADGLDDARALVAQHDRPRALPVAVADVQVGVADARRGHPHEDLARPRVVEAQRLDGVGSPARSMTAAWISRMPVRCLASAAGSAAPR